MPRWVPGNGRNVLFPQRRKSESEWQQVSAAVHTSVRETATCFLQLLVTAMFHSCDHSTQSLLVFTPASLYMLAFFLPLFQRCLRWPSGFARTIQGKIPFILEGDVQGIQKFGMSAILDTSFGLPWRFTIDTGLWEKSRGSQFWFFFFEVGFHHIALTGLEFVV